MIDLSDTVVRWLERDTEDDAVSVECSLPPAAESVSSARRFVTEALDGLPRRTVETLTLMVSELATNCVLHARSGFRVRVTQTAREVRVEVSDAGPGQARLRWPPATEPHGRGLRIVDRLADRWGVIATRGGPGKTVWFTLSVAGQPSGSLGQLP